MQDLAHIQAEIAILQAKAVAIDLIDGIPTNKSNEEARQAKKDRDAARQRALRAANPEKMRAEQRALYAANSEKMRAQANARYAANPEKNLAQQRVRYAANPEKMRAQRNARDQAKKLEKLAALQAQTKAAAAAEPAEVENVVPPTKKPFDSWAFIASMYKTPKDLQETLDTMTPRQIAKAQRRFRP